MSTNISGCKQYLILACLSHTHCIQTWGLDQECWGYNWVLKEPDGCGTPMEGDSRHQLVAWEVGNTEGGRGSNSTKSWAP